MSTDGKSIAVKCFVAGNSAVAKGSFDYAIQMYSACVKQDPGNLAYRQALRGAEQRLYGGNGTGAKMAAMKLMGPTGKAKKARMQKDWKTLAEAAEEGLAVNPWHAGFNADLGDACRELGHAEVAMFAYEESIKADGTNKDVLRSLAGILESRSDFVKASGVWDRVAKLDPYDGEARSKVMATQAESAIKKSGLAEAETTRPTSAYGYETDTRLSKGPQIDGPGMSVEADLLRAIRKDPKNKDNFLKLVDYYKREGKLADAAKQLEEAVQVSGGDANIKEMLEDVQLDLLQNELQAARAQASEQADDASLKQKVIELHNELVKRQLDVFSRRTERYPNDMRLKFELAKLHMQVQNWQKAIPLLQASRGDPRIKGEALVSLGRCFIKDNKVALGRRQYEAAIPEVNFDEKPDLFKNLFYSLARICEDQKDLKAAEEYYQKVLEVDYEYRDAVARLDALQAQGG
jgi:tetratricopeptide (TPR) repeat protein